MRAPTLGSLFSGYGGLDMAVENMLGGQVVWHCENDKDAAKVLAQHKPDVPNLGDIATVDWPDVAGVDVLVGGFPCTDLSYAGQRKGLAEGTRSGLWSRMAAAIDALQPKLVVIENVRGILSAKADNRADRGVEPCPSCLGETGDRPSVRALGVVLSDLADLRFDTRWVGVRASDAGAPHQRYRIFIAGIRRDESGDGAVADAGGLDQGVPPPKVGLAQVREQHGDRAGLDALDPARPGDDTTRAGGDGEGEAASDADGPRRPRPGSEKVERGVADRGGPGSAADLGRVEDLCRIWGPYAAAIGRWERILGRPAPFPYETRADGGRRLNPKLVEFLMGIPAGFVTDVDGLSYRTMLRILGNGVVVQQAELALRLLLADRDW